MKILVTGGTGMIGSVLCADLVSRGHELVLLTRQVIPSEPSKRAVRNLAEIEPSEVIDAVINLAGEPIAAKRWSAAQKETIRNSRIGLTRDLVDWISERASKPQVFVSGSAIGYYGGGIEDEAVTEDAGASGGFSHELCQDWENAALGAEQFGVRTCLLRTGIVLGDGGALSKMLLPFKLGLGGPMGSGRQWMPWIHIRDMVEIIQMCLESNALSGPINCTAPEPVTNQEFVSALGQALHRPAVMPMPGFVVKAMMGEMGDELLLQGKRVVPKVLLDSGYQFRYTLVTEALMDVLEK